jgi:hypothetical protein
MAVLKGGKKTVTTAGTAERISTTQSGVTSIVIRAETTNTGQIFVGDADVASTDNAGLDAGESLSMPLWLSPISLTNIWIDASMSTDGVDYWFTTVN